jgi:SAM-dependent methyltransferase
MNASSEFDRHADTYDDDLNQALAVSGEDKEYFARGRIRWLERCLRRLQEQPGCAIDYGCGIGDTSAILRAALSLRSVVGLDVSARSLELARRRNRSQACRFLSFEQYVPERAIDLVYCNGVFHHIPPAQRVSVVDYIHKCLRPGGLFALWENNPWNPGTRYVMSRTAFDRDAMPLTPSQSKRLLRSCGFQILSVDFLFLFPRMLSVLRFMEWHLHRVPLGAQYQVLCRRSS